MLFTGYMGTLSYLFKMGGIVCVLGATIKFTKNSRNKNVRVIHEMACIVTMIFSVILIAEIALDLRGETFSGFLNFRSWRRLIPFM